MAFPPLLNVKFIRLFLAVLIIASTSACLDLKKKQTIETPIAVKKVEPKPQYSVAPIKKPIRSDILFVQSALKKVGYRIGAVDGIWGKRSASALIAFESTNDLWSADGFLSELNMHTLSLKSGLSRQNFIIKPTSAGPKKIAQLLKKNTPLEKGPQLIIIERDYLVMSKANPYSSKLSNLVPGTGIYIIARQDNWYQIETLERQAGFIKVD